jgi:hypothetical protein
MRLMGGAVVESGVVGVLFGVGEELKKSKVKIRSQKVGLAGESSASTQSQATSQGLHLPFGTGGDARRSITAKRLGERAEAAFLAKVAGLGFGVAKPWGDSDRYDFIVDAGGKLWRVQVKSAHRAGQDGEVPRLRSGFRLRAPGFAFAQPHARITPQFGHSLGAYKEDEIDVLVCYVAPMDAWYVFPPDVFLGRRSVKLFGGSRRLRSKFEAYREAWWVLGSTSAAKAATSGKG